ncbi:MAG: hypothetical protein IJN39_03510, partial [Clostridia bacterium]|nr:hypothetical protein [Clostridia bacterium]
GYINVASSQGIIIGDDTGIFRPEDDISYQEAVTILIRVLGHEPAAKSKGGYPSGYLVQGAQIGVTNDVTATSTSAATRGMVAQMTFNSLTVNLMEQTGFGNNLNYEIVEKTLLEDKLDVYTDTGIITGNDETKLNGVSGLKADVVEIGEGKLFKVGESDADKLLGYTVDYYYKKNKNDNELILANPTKDNEAVSIEAKNLAEELKEGATTISYYKSEDDAKATKANLEDSYSVIYNQKHKASLVHPKTGNITLLDNDGDGVYDIVFIGEHVNYVIDSVSSFAKKVYDKYGKEPLSLDTDSNSDLKVIIEDTEGKEMKLEDLKEWDVLSVYKNDNYVRAIVSRNTVSGSVTETRENGEKVIDSKEYKVAENLNANDLELQMEGIFYLDFEGKIAGYDATARQTANYAFLLNAALKDGMTPELSVKLFDAEGKEIVYTAAEKIRFNSTTAVASETIFEKLKADGKVVPQLITYELNSEGKLAEIYTAEDKTASFPESFLKSRFSLNFKGDELEFKSASNKLNIKDKDGKVTGSIGVNSSTVVFDIPLGETDTDNMAVRNSKMFTDGSTYNVLAYDMTEDHVATVLLVTNSVNVEKLESPIAIVDKIATIKNEDNMQVEKLYAYVNGEAISEVTESASILTVDGKKLKTGDIIQYTTNIRGEIDGVTVLFRADDKGTEFMKHFGDNNEMITLYGKVTKKFADSINVSVDGGAAVNYNVEGATVYSYDSSKTSNKLSVASAGDITKWEDSANEVRVFIRIYQDQVKEIVIVQ